MSWSPTWDMARCKRKQTRTNNTYNGLQASLRLQNKWGLSGEADYTYSHAIDLGDNGGC
jgi:hypothetical protein